MVNRLPGDSNIYQTLADQLSQIGVDVELRPVTFPSWISNYLPGTWGDDIDGFTLSWNALPYNDVIRPMEYYSCLKTIPFYCDEGLTAQVVAAAGDMNSKSREMRLFDLAEEIHNRAPSLFLVEINEILAASPSVQGLRVANRVAVYEEITLSAE
jgi:ABC-type transport system substrate-binding protein